MTLEELRTHYQGKRVLLTGHTGFKGSWLLLLLHELGAQVTGYALPPQGQRPLFTELGGSRLAHKHVMGDLSNLQLLSELVRDTQPEVVFHMAAQSLVRRSYQNPVETFRTNTQGTAHLLEAIRLLEGPCQVLAITTDKVYENREAKHAYTEGEPLGGYDPYSASKAAAELLIQSYRRSFFNPSQHAIHEKALASARAGNVIGGGDRAEDRLLPDVVRALQAQEPIVLRNPKAIRPWQHVLEPLWGYLMLAAKLAQAPDKLPGAYNFGPAQSDCLPVQKVAQLAVEAWRAGEITMQAPEDAPHEAGLLMLDNSLAKQRIGWVPKLSPQEAIAWTMEWHREEDNPKQSPTDRCLAQLAAYAQRWQAATAAN